MISEIKSSHQDLLKKFLSLSFLWLFAWLKIFLEWNEYKLNTHATIILGQTFRICSISNISVSDITTNSKQYGSVVGKKSET